MFEARPNLLQFTLPASLLQVVGAARRSEALRWALLTFAVLRIGTELAALIMVHNVPAPPPSWLFGRNPSGQTYIQALPADSPFYAWIEPWHRWDTAWYVKDAIQGYRANDPGIVFPPLYPVLIRLTSLFCDGNYVLASLIVSNIACFVLLYFLFKLVELEFGSAALARRTLICLAVCPSAYYLVAGYSESMFIALVVGAFYSTLKRRWWLAGALAGLAALTRLQGALLFLPLGWIAYVQLRQTGVRALVARLPVLVGGPLGALGYLGYLALNQLGTLEDAYAREWREYTRLPMAAIQEFAQRLSSGRSPFWEMNNAVTLLVLLILGLVVLFKLRPAYSLYMSSALFMILLRFHGGSQFEGMIRYALVMFPAFIVVAMALRRWWLLLPVALAALYWQAYLLDRFLHWRWVA